MRSIIWNNFKTLVIDCCSNLFLHGPYFLRWKTLGCYISIVFSNYNSNYAYSHIQGQCSIQCTDADDKLIELKNPETWEKILNAGKIRQYIVAEVKVDSDSGFIVFLVSS